MKSQNVSTTQLWSNFLALNSPLVKTSEQVRDELEFLQSKLDCCLVIDGDSLQVS